MTCRFYGGWRQYVFDVRICRSIAILTLDLNSLHYQRLDRFFACAYKFFRYPRIVSERPAHKSRNVAQVFRPEDFSYARPGNTLTSEEVSYMRPQHPTPP